MVEKHEEKYVVLSFGVVSGIVLVLVALILIIGYFISGNGNYVIFAPILLIVGIQQLLRSRKDFNKNGT